MKSTKKQNKRYRLHQIVKHHFEYDARKNTVYVPVGYESKKHTSKIVKALEQLNDLGYSLQIKIV